MSLEERAHVAPIVFVGTVVGGEICNGYRWVCEAEIEVESYLKGNGSAIVWVSGFGVGTDCHPSIEMGDRRIFFVQGNPDEILQVLWFLGYNDATPIVTDENISRIVSVTHQSTVPEAMPIVTRVDILGNRYNGYLVQIGLISFGIILVALLAIWWRGRRKSKSKRREV